jgi:hypothetical protein
MKTDGMNEIEEGKEKKKKNSLWQFFFCFDTFSLWLICAASVS